MSFSHVTRMLPLADRALRFAAGARIFGAADAVRFLFVVQEGAVQLVRRQPDGAALVLQRVGPGELVAEASLFAPRYHCEAVAQGPTRLARIPRAAVLALQIEDASWLQAFAEHLAREVQRARARAELLSHKRVGQRLDAWLALYGPDPPERGRWAAWAGELGVSPEALYRELARRRR